MVALCYNKQAVDKRWSSGVVVNMPPCHGGDRGFKSHMDRRKYIRFWFQKYKFNSRMCNIASIIL